MVMGWSYAYEARRQIEMLGKRRRDRGSASFGSLVSELLAHWLVGSTDEELLEGLRAKLNEPDSHERTYWVPVIGLQKAVVAALLGQPALPYLKKCAAAWEPADQSVELATPKKNLSTWAMLAFAWAGEAEGVRTWLQRRTKLDCESRALADGPAIQLARDWQRQKEFSLPGLEACIASDALLALDDDVLTMAATLLAAAEHKRQELRVVVADQRAAMDEELWHDGPDEAPRAQDSPLVWMRRKDRLVARVQVTGEGAPIDNVAPFAVHAYELAPGLDKMIMGDWESGYVDGARSRKQVSDALASSSTDVALTYVHTGTARLSAAGMRCCGDILEATSAWLKHRHGEKFHAKLSWELSDTSP
jgi:hypothetical protein